jgi:starvation-inducible DNA-binding protein
MVQGTATQTLTDSLNKQIANWGILYVKLHNYHWYVTGEHFYELHTKFEEFYTEAATYIDELAERLLALKGKPVATMRDFLQNASITEATGNETPQQMVQNIANDFNTTIEELKQGIEIANNANDDSTADMLTGIRTSVEKHLWMLNSFLSK